MPKITFLNDPCAEADADGVTRPKSIEVPVGTSLLEAAKKIHAQVGYACGGVCACSTCHVVVKEGGDTCNSATEDEDDQPPDRGLAALTHRPPPDRWAFLRPIRYTTLPRVSANTWISMCRGCVT